MSDVKLICFDLDKTLIKENSWYELNLALGISKEDDEVLFHQYKNKEISYDEWNNILLEKYKASGKATRQHITVALSKYSYRRGVQEVIAYLKDKDYKIGLISGSIDILVNMIAEELGIDLFEANSTFVFDDNDCLVNIINTGDNAFGKLKLLEDVAEKMGIGLDECACIGDGDNDIEMFKATGRGITFKGSHIEEDAWKVIGGLVDLKEIF
jgi:phosphoserine phosphatase